MRGLVVSTIILTFSVGPGATVAAEEEAVPTGAFSPAGKLNQARLGHTAILQPDGSVVIFGGEAVDSHGTAIRPSTEIWDPESASYTPVEPPVEAPGVILATLNDGRVLSRWHDGRSEHAWGVWDPLTGDRTQIGEPLADRGGHSTVPVADGRILIVGGSGPDSRGRDRPLRSAEILDPATSTFSWTDGLPEAGVDFTATLLVF